MFRYASLILIGCDSEKALPLDTWAAHYLCSGGNLRPGSKAHVSVVQYSTGSSNRGYERSEIH